MFGTKSRNKLETASFQLKVSLTQHGVVWCGELNIVRGWFSMLPWNMFYADVVQRTTLHLIGGWYLQWMLNKSYLALTLMKPDLIFVDKIFEIRHSKYFVEQGLNIWVSDWACHITHPDCVRARKYQSKHYIYTISTLVIVKHLSIFGSSLHSWRTPGRSGAQWLRRWKQTPYFIIIIVNVRAAL